MAIQPRRPFLASQPIRPEVLEVTLELAPLVEALAPRSLAAAAGGDLTCLGGFSVDGHTGRDPLLLTPMQTNDIRSIKLSTAALVL